MYFFEPHLHSYMDATFSRLIVLKNIDLFIIRAYKKDKKGQCMACICKFS